MQKTNNVDHLEMLCPRKRLKKYVFPEGFEITHFDGSQSQKNAVFSMWEERDGSLEEVNAAFERRFFSQADCLPEKDMFFVKYQGEYVGSLTAIYHKEQSLGHLHYVMLDKKYRDKRLSYPLLYIGMKKLHKQGCSYIFLNTDDWRKSAIKLYLNYGFLPQIDSRNTDITKDHIERWKKIYKELTLQRYLKMMMDWK